MVGCAKTNTKIYLPNKLYISNNPRSFVASKKAVSQNVRRKSQQSFKLQAEIAKQKKYPTASHFVNFITKYIVASKLKSYFQKSAKINRKVR